MQVTARTRRPAAAAVQHRPPGAARGFPPCWGSPELFFAEDPRDIERAKELCRGCPLRADCLEGALQRGEPAGVWGGELLERGRVIGQKRARGRPRKHHYTGPARAGARPARPGGEITRR